MSEKVILLILLILFFIAFSLSGFDPDKDTFENDGGGDLPDSPY